MIDDVEAKRAVARLDYEAMTAEAAERVKYQVALVDRGLQSLMLINGGALVALFTLLGSTVQLRVDTHFLWTAFALFACGLALTLLANLAAYFSQGMYYQVSQFVAWDAQRGMLGLVPERTEAIAATICRGQHAEFGGVAAAVLALVSFVLGCELAFSGVLPG